MTQQADFYVLAASDPEARTHFACRLVNKILHLGHQIYIQATNEAEAKRFDQQLWEFLPESFIPHSLTTEDLPAKVKVGWGQLPPEQRPSHRDVFVNLDLDIAEDALHYGRILEVIPQVEDILSSTRRNYKLYQAKGIAIEMHDMRPKPTA